MIAYGECKGDDNFDLCFPADKLGIMLSAARDSIEINAFDQKAVSKSGKSKFNFSTIDGADYPVIDAENNGVSCANINLREVIANVHLCAAKNDARIFLNGINITSNGSEVRATATDGRIIASHKINSVTNQFSALVPYETAKIISAIDSVGFSVNDRRNIQVQLADGSKIISKLLDVQFPSWERIVAFESAGFFSVDSDEFKKQIDTASKISSDNKINLDAKNGSLNITSASSDGSFESELECQGDELITSFDAGVLRTAIDTIQASEFSLHFDSNFKQFKFESDDLVVVAMPLRA
jgi:DNA polymerase III sliding clamp (beta) subunit (PCNA family)